MMLRQNFTEELQEQTIAAAMSLGVAFQLTWLGLSRPRDLLESF